MGNANLRTPGYPEFDAMKGSMTMIRSNLGGWSRMEVKMNTIRIVAALVLILLVGLGADSALAAAVDWPIDMSPIR